jgi:hypothetical protein
MYSHYWASRAVLAVNLAILNIASEREKERERKKKRERERKKFFKTKKVLVLST